MGLPPEALRDLEWLRDDFSVLVGTASPAELDVPSHGTRWTNRELLFHMWFGQRIARVFVPLMGAFCRLPDPAQRAWARLLTATTRLYSWVNYIGSVGGARVLGIGFARRMMDADTAWLLRWAEHASPQDLARGMHVPTSWDPYFTDWMDRADVLAWAPKHYRHHRAQLSLSNPGGAHRPSAAGSPPPPG